MSDTLDEQQNSDPHIDRERVMREILDARADRLSKPLANDTLASEFVELLLFSVGRDRFAIETRFVTEVIRHIDVTPVPGDTLPLIGLANLRGEVLAIMSLASAITLGSDVEPEHIGNWIMVLGVDQPMFGVAISDVTEVVAVSQDEILDSKVATSQHASLIRGVTKDARVVIRGRELLEDERFVIDQD